MLTQEYIKSILNYDPETGLITWAITTSKVKAGNLAGAKAHGYVQIRINNKLQLGHRLVWLHYYGYMPNKWIDHINGIRDDNRICNLRLSNESQNQENRRNPNKINSSGFLGVHFNKSRNRYIAKICVKGKIKHLGEFYDAEIAHEAYLKAKRELHEFCTI